MKKLIVTPNGSEYVDMTAEEISQIEIDEQNFQAQKTTKDAEQQAKEDLKASAKAKLIAGESLTEDEANTIVL